MTALLGLKKKHQPLSETHWEQVLSKLRRARLIVGENEIEPGGIGAHPLVREHFGGRLKSKYPAAWREGHARLFKHLREKVKPKFPETPEDVSMLYAAVTHGCHAGQHKSAFGWVYYTRIQRTQRFYAANRLAGSVHSDLDALSCFFPNGWEEPVTDLQYPLRALLLGQAGYRLWMVGKLNEAITPMVKALAADKEEAEEAQKVRPTRDGWKYVSVDADTIAGIHLALGNLPQAIKYSEQSVKYATESSDFNQQISVLNTKGDIQHHMGAWKEAEATFRRAEELKISYQPAIETKGRRKPPPSFHNPLGHRYCDLLLDLGRLDEALDILAPILKSQKEEPDNFNLIDKFMTHLLLGQAQLSKASHAAPEQFEQIKVTLDQAMIYLRDAGRVVHLPRGLMALAEWHLIGRKFDQAQAILEEALDVATLGQLKLHQADCLLKFARLYLARGEGERARASWAKAREMIEQMGYGRRNKDVWEIDEQLTAAGA